MTRRTVIALLVSATSCGLFSNYFGQTMYPSLACAAGGQCADSQAQQNTLCEPACCNQGKSCGTHQHINKCCVCICDAYNNKGECVPKPDMGIP